jgi:hypothetical protein
LIGIQSRADAVVYVLGRIEKKSKRGTGFLSAD